MRVLYVIPGLGIGGGAERSLLDMAPGLLDAGIELSILYFHDRPSSAVGQFRDAGVSCARVEAHTFAQRVKVVRREIRDHRPAIVHTTLFEADLVGRLASWGLPSKLMTSLVSTPYDRARRCDPAYSRWRIGLIRVLDAVTLRWRVDHAHAISETAKQSAVDHLGLAPERATVIPRGRELQRYQAVAPGAAGDLRSELGVSPQAPVVLMVARQEATKGHLTLLEALPEVLGAYPEAVFLLVGRDGAMSQQIGETIAARGWSTSVIQLGYRRDVMTLLAVADVFVHPSVLEGGGGAILEAMASGTPVVAASIGAIREVVDEESAILVPPHDGHALAQGITGVLGDPAAAAARAGAAKAFVGKHRTVEKSAHDLAQLYETVAST